MLTAEQTIWINHLSDKDLVKISPFDPTSEEKFQKSKNIVQTALVDEFVLDHHGASSLGISGQDEIDAYIPVSPERFDDLILPLKNLFGEPQSLYPLNRARFVTIIDGKHIDIFLINKEADSWKLGIKFEEYLKSHPESLVEYKDLKEKGHGLNVREYYRKKIEFINDILSR